MTINRLTRRLFGASVAAMALMGSYAAASAADLNALVWCDHSDPNLLKPFEDATGIKVNVKEFEGTGAGLAIVEQSQPGDWDVMVIAEIFPEVLMDQHSKFDGKRYGITEKFGYNTIGFNKSKVEAADMETLGVLTNDKYKGRIAIYDYYLPVMGLAAMAIGKKTSELTEADLPAIKEVLQKMKANAKALTDVVASQTALATGEADILIGGGEWVTAGIAKENPDLDFSIPKEGAVLWSQSLAMFKDSKNKDNALKFIQYIMSPEGQARLATSSCYWGMPASKAAALDADQKKILRFDEQPEFLKRAQGYPAPSEDLDKKMQDLWTAMIQGQ